MIAFGRNRLSSMSQLNEFLTRFGRRRTFMAGRDLRRLRSTAKAVPKVHAVRAFGFARRLIESVMQKSKNRNNLRVVQWDFR